MVVVVMSMNSGMFCLEVKYEKMLLGEGANKRKKKNDAYLFVLSLAESCG